MSHVEFNKCPYVTCRPVDFRGQAPVSGSGSGLSQSVISDNCSGDTVMSSRNTKTAISLDLFIISIESPDFSLDLSRPLMI